MLTPPATSQQEMLKHAEEIVFPQQHLQKVIPHQENVKLDTSIYQTHLSKLLSKYQAKTQLHQHPTSEDLQ